MRADLASLGFVITLLSASLAHGQVSIDVSKITCAQFARGEVGLPRTTAIWLNGYYHGKIGSTSIDTQQSNNLHGAYEFLPNRRKWQSAHHAGT